jgi:hypothetical protein
MSMVGTLKALPRSSSRSRIIRPNGGIALGARTRDRSEDGQTASDDVNNGTPHTCTAPRH